MTRDDGAAPVRRRRRIARAGLAGAAVTLALLAALVVFAVLDPDGVLAIGRRVSFARAGAHTGTVEVNGLQVAYAELGRGRPVLMVHGLGGESAGLLQLARELAPRGYRVVLIDLPGAGRSPLPPVPLTIESAGDYATGAATALGLGPRPAIVGHSLGGWIVAWQALAHPERMGPVVLTCPAGLTFEPPPLNELMPRTVEDGRRNLARLFSKPPWVPTPVLWLAVHRSRNSNLALLRSATSGRYLLDGLLPGFSVPALVIAGADDGIVPAASSREMARRIPGARFVLVNDASHMVVWEKPREVAVAIDGFLRDNP